MTSNSKGKLEVGSFVFTVQVVISMVYGQAGLTAGLPEHMSKGLGRFFL